MPYTIYSREANQMLVQVSNPLKGYPGSSATSLLLDIIIVGSCYHIEESDELALLQVPEIDALRSQFQV